MPVALGFSHPLAVAPFTDRYFKTAVGAWLKYGKGRRMAALNFGGCLVYAVAQ
ncbi:MAG TPA: type II toxin-antitoxin system VapC family toxin [Anaerolineae bacterium]|jgi:uncharacterized protein with PIN domain|nr:type II toxin-antitoxin system VapC family toxin [Anaerolineae bacterium]